jgi:hypothetical protein
MDSVRLAPADSVFPALSCCRCDQDQRHWDRIANKPFCPNCLESLALGEGEPLIERRQPQRCAVCHHQGTLRFLTFPLESLRPVEIDLCGEHLRGLIARRLGPLAFEQLRRQLYALGIQVGEIFLLHDAFYDLNGRALKPAGEVS